MRHECSEQDRERALAMERLSANLTAAGLAAVVKQLDDELYRAAYDSECKECGGATVKFRFAGKDTQYKLCSRWRTPGHLSESEWRGKIQSALLAALPSGRQA